MYPGSSRSKNCNSLFFVVFFQIILCLILGCNGISIVWCAMMGWETSTTHQITRERNHTEGAYPSETAVRIIDLGRTVIILDVLAIFYYTITAEAITTIAHICAVILGVFLEQLARFTSSMSGTSSEKEPIIQ